MEKILCNKSLESTNGKGTFARMNIGHYWPMTDFPRIFHSSLAERQGHYTDQAWPTPTAYARFPSFLHFHWGLRVAVLGKDDGFHFGRCI